MARRRYKGKRFRVDRKAILVSDTHFYHKNIMLYDGRTPFLTADDLEIYQEYNRTGKVVAKISDESLTRMNEGIIAAINAEVEDPLHDTVIINGDFVFGNSVNQYRRNAETIREQINCRDMRIVWGNHDEPAEIYDLFTDSYDQTLLYLGSQPCFFNHFPLVTWDGPPQTIHLHGHVHGLYERETHPHPMARSNLWLAKDIGVNTNNFRPYTLPLVLESLQHVCKEREAIYAAKLDHLIF